MIQTIRKTIVSGLNKYTNVLVVDTDNPNEKPKYPFLSFKITTMRQNQGKGGSRNTRFEKSLDENFRHDVVESISFQPYMVLSISAYSNNVVESQELAFKAWEWFKFVGKYALEEINCVVVDTQNVQDRTTHIVDFYEYKQGFDVSIRYLHEIERRTETIEEYEIKGEMI